MRTLFPQTVLVWAAALIACGDSPRDLPTSPHAFEVPARSFAPLAPNSGLIGWWRGDNHTRDVIGGNHGILRGDADFAPGVAGPAFRFDGDGDFVEVPNAPELNPARVTVAFWMLGHPDNAMDTCCQGLVTTDFWGVEIAPGAGEVTGAIMFVSAEEHHWVHSSDLGAGGRPIPPGEWHHIAGTYDGAHVSLYVDGTLAQQAPASGTLLPMNPQSFLSFGSEDGRQYDPHLGPRYFRGLIDDVRIYDRPLSADEVGALYGLLATAAGRR